MVKRQLVIATRQSRLALWQANFVRDQLLATHPGLSVELLGLTTQGDKWLNAPLAAVGGKGLFIKELEQALADGRADLAVHSAKDLPAALPEGFALPVIAFRADVRDALVAAGVGLQALPRGARVGSSSLRRQAQLLRVRPDLQVSPVRGNVETRLSKLGSDFDALVLACAGLERLELVAQITERLPVEVCLPAAGQGALAIECRADATEVLELLAPLDDPSTRAEVTAERAVSAGLGADCSAPLAAFATPDDAGLRLRARLAAPDGSRLLSAEVVGVDPQAMGAAVVEDLLAQGAAQLLHAGD